MTKQEYEKEKATLSVRFLREKKAGNIPLTFSWSEWCWQNGIYPLTDSEPTK